MRLELYFYNECGFSQRVLNCITNLQIGDRVVQKNIRENADYEKELISLCGDQTVPTLVVDGKPMRDRRKLISFWSTGSWIS